MSPPPTPRLAQPLFQDGSGVRPPPRVIVGAGFTSMPVSRQVPRRSGAYSTPSKGFSQSTQVQLVTRGPVSIRHDLPPSVVVNTPLGNASVPSPATTPRFSSKNCSA